MTYKKRYIRKQGRPAQAQATAICTREVHTRGTTRRERRGGWVDTGGTGSVKNGGHTAAGTATREAPRPTPPPDPTRRGSHTNRTSRQTRHSASTGAREGRALTGTEDAQLPEQQLTPARGDGLHGTTDASCTKHTQAQTKVSEGERVPPSRERVATRLGRAGRRARPRPLSDRCGR